MIIKLQIIKQLLGYRREWTELENEYNFPVPPPLTPLCSGPAEEGAMDALTSTRGS